jgi:hypothetical protein
MPAGRTGAILDVQRIRGGQGMMATHHIHCVVIEGINHDPVHGEQLRWGVVSDMDLVRAARAGMGRPAGILSTLDIAGVLAWGRG